MWAARSLARKQTACWQAARMRWQFTCVGSSLGSLAADAHVGGGRVLSLRRGALAARREDEESSLGLPCERSACVRWVMRRTRFVSEDGRRSLCSARTQRRRLSERHEPCR